MRFLTISEEHKLRLEVKQLTKKQDEITIMKMRHEKEMKEMREEMHSLLSLKNTLIKEGILKES